MRGTTLPTILRDSSTSCLSRLWECFPFKQTRSCRRWRRVCRGVKETGVVNESVEAGEFLQLLRDSLVLTSWTLVLVYVLMNKFVREAVGGASPRSRLWFLSYRVKPSHLIALYLLLTFSSGITTLSAVNATIIGFKNKPDNVVLCLVFFLSFFS